MVKMVRKYWLPVFFSVSAALAIIVGAGLLGTNLNALFNYIAGKVCEGDAC